MSVYRRFAAENLPSFITTSTSGRCPIFGSPATCDLLIRIIYDVRQEMDVLLLAFAVMPDHLHLVLVPPKGELGKVVQLVKGRFAGAYNERASRAGPVWQTRYHERTLRTEAALVRAIDYVHHNPVASRLASAPGDYPWSSANVRYATDFQQYVGQAEA